MGLTEQRNQLFYKGVGGPSVTLSSLGGGQLTNDQNNISGVGQDLTSWNIARGRDHGIKAYSSVVSAYFGSNQAGCTTSSGRRNLNGGSWRMPPMKRSYGGSPNPISSMVQSLT